MVGFQTAEVCILAERSFSDLIITELQEIPLELLELEEELPDEELPDEELEEAQTTLRGSHMPAMQHSSCMP